MVIVMEHFATEEQVQKVIETLVEVGYDVHRSTGVNFTVLGAVGVPRRPIDAPQLELIPGVREVVKISEPYKLVGRTFKPEDTVVDLSGVLVGGAEVIAMAGPCSVETREQVGIVARSVAASGARVLRGGAFKPRTSPYAFQGLETEGLKLLDEARRETGLPVITEVMEPDKVDLVAEHSDILQIGARNVQNFSLLRRVAETRMPVLLKRGMSTSIQEWLLSAEYVLAGGNPNVILCERGIRTFETATRFTLDLNAVPVLKKLTHLPVVVDPSHGTGHWEYVESMALAGVAAGADGLLIEVHPKPEEALSDGPQSLKPDKFAALMARVRKVAQAVDRDL
jgi:3-deoxy-7-phosphoheptulonate synthase